MQRKPFSAWRGNSPLRTAADQISPWGSKPKLTANRNSGSATKMPHGALSRLFWAVCIIGAVSGLAAMFLYAPVPAIAFIGLILLAGIRVGVNRPSANEWVKLLQRLFVVECIIGAILGTFVLLWYAPAAGLGFTFLVLTAGIIVGKIRRIKTGALAALVLMLCGSWPLAALAYYQPWTTYSYAQTKHVIAVVGAPQSLQLATQHNENVVVGTVADYAGTIDSNSATGWAINRFKQLGLTIRNVPVLGDAVTAYCGDLAVHVRTETPSISYPLEIEADNDRSASQYPGVQKCPPGLLES